MATAVIDLSHFRKPATLSAMSTCRARSSTFSILLAVLAVLGLVILSGWHNATIHDHEILAAVTIEQGHDHGAPAHSETDGPIHILAHATGHWVALDEPFAAASAPLAGPDRVWPILSYGLGGSIDPTKLLRPPRG